MSSLVMENEETRRGRPRQPDDAARRQRAGVRHGVPAWLGGGHVPQPASAGRKRRQGSGGRTPARLCRPDPRAAARHRQPCREPPHLRQLAEPASPAASSTSCRTRKSNGPARRRCRAKRGCSRRPHSLASFRWWRGGPGDRGLGAAGRPARADAIPVGARVFHQKFGYGTVKSAEDDRLDIEFDKAGEKRVLDRFVEKA